MKKILIIIIVVFLMLMSFAACKKDGPKNNAPKLDTPSNIRLDGTTLLWDEVANADQYVITVFTNTSSYTLTQATTTYAIPVTSIGDYIATVKARRVDGTYKDSEATSPITYHLGAGTELDPILIYSKEELAKIGLGAKITTSGSQSTTTPYYYKLTRDIDLGGMEWAPIGVGDNRFQGHFDGQGYTVSNYKITVAVGSYHGLFKGVLNGSVKNLNVSDYNINIQTNGRYRIGGLAGYVTNSTIESCSANGNINYKSTDGSSSDQQHIGQMIGYMDSASNVIDCYANGVLIAEGNTVFTGGLVGYNTTGKIRYSYSLGTVNIKAGIINAGGLAGSSQGANSLVSNCYSRTSLSTEATGANNTGSLIGYLYNSTTLEYSYATGSVTGTSASTTASNLRLGFIGYALGTLYITEAYYDYETVGLGENKDKGNSPFDHLKIYSRTTAQMKTQVIYNNWDFENVWIIDENVNDGYPTLRPYVAPVAEEEEEEEA